MLMLESFYKRCSSLCLHETCLVSYCCFVFF
uniref:Uncharacterized protein n=1 Tax=Rhizophora mucronata TaxID=61149 RepID=A0A2P2MXM0_RHIMU